MGEPELKIEMLEVAALEPYAANPKPHTPEQVKRIAASIREFGFIVPVLVDARKRIIAGHGRVLAAQEIGLRLVPCCRLEHLSEAQARAFRLADNRLAEAPWDAGMLRVELADLRDLGAELEPYGFTEHEWRGESDADQTPKARIDEADSLQVKWETSRGQIWRVRRHRLMCGDATCAEDVARLLGDAKPMLTITDPPYGVDYDPAWRQKAAEAGHLAYAARRVGEVTNDDRDDWSAAWALCRGDVVYCWHGSLHGGAVQAALGSAGFETRALLIWAKRHFPISRGHYHWRHEPCWYAVRKGGKSHWIGDHSQTTLWDDITLDENVEGGHSTQKPLECMARPLRNHEGDVYDPFIGTGTTMVAAERLDRICYGMDIEPKYCAVALERLREMGLEPRLEEGDGTKGTAVEADAPEAARG